MNPGAPRVLAVVVTYHPHGESLMSLLQALFPQVEGLLVVDNTPVESPLPVLETVMQVFPRLEMRSMGQNVGIGAAQNVGIRTAIEKGYDYVLLSDQDSRPDASMVQELVGIATALRGSGVMVGCVCPAYFDETTDQAFRFQVQESGRVFYRTMPADHADPCAEIVVTISSGSLIPVSTLKAIGGMREDFFIDHVDTEWCHRARAAGFHNFGTARARLVHRLGDAPFQVWFFGWHGHSEYSPTRLYYRFRNFLLLVRLPHVPWRWSIRAGWYWLGNLYAHCLFAANGQANAKAIARGLLDGLRGRTGPATGVG